MSEDLRKQAEQSRKSAEAAFQTSEYPRTGRSAYLAQAEALEALADVSEGVVKRDTPSEGMTGDERRAARAERLRLKAAARQVEATRLNVEAHNLASVVPFGQPILVGHHSEKGHRRLLAKVDRKTGQSIEAHREAEQLASAAERVERSGAILAQDSDAQEQLEHKIESLKAQRDDWKAINAAWRAFTRKTKPTREKFYALGWSDQEIDRCQEKIKADNWWRCPVAPYQFTNLGARLKAAEARLERLRQSNTTASEAGDEEVNGVKIVRNVAENRLQLLFPDKPDVGTRTALKRLGYRWSPRNSAWQRHLNTLQAWQLEQTKEVLKVWSV